VRDTNAAQSLLRELITPRKRLQMNEDNNWHSLWYFTYTIDYGIFV
jgi:hypothetical protein